MVNRTGNIVLHGVNEVDNRDDRVNLFIALCIIDQVHFQIDAVGLGRADNVKDRYQSNGMNVVYKLPTFECFSQQE